LVFDWLQPGEFLAWIFSVTMNNQGLR